MIKCSIAERVPEVNMDPNDRRKAIYDIINARRQVDVVWLARNFHVSGMTIRRDLNALEEADLIERAYGIAKIKYADSNEHPFADRAISDLAGKQQIAKTALPYLTGAASLFIDGSTTVNELVKCLPANHPITIYTNSVASLITLRQMEWVRPYVFGGFLASDKNTLEDDAHLDMVKHTHVDVAFISCSGFSVDGIVNNGISGSRVKRIMLENATRCYLLATKNKWNRPGIYKLGYWHSLDALITDEEPEVDVLFALHKAGVNVVW